MIMGSSSMTANPIASPFSAMPGPLEVVIDMAPPNAAPMVEVTAAILTEWDRRGYAVGLRTADGEYPAGANSLGRLLDILAVVNCFHGVPGEDGTLQAMFDLAEAPTARAITSPSRGAQALR